MNFYVALTGLVLLAQLRPVLVTDPVYPANALEGGTVVATLVVENGVVEEVAILSGEEPFTESVEKALRSWRFPQSITHVSIPVVTHFRTPLGRTLNVRPQEAAYRGRIDIDLTLFEPKVFFNVQPPLGSSRDRSMAYPIQVVEPAYPVNAVGQGSAVLRLGIDKKGNVSRVEAIKGLGDGFGEFVENAKVSRVDTSKDLGLLVETFVSAARRWRFSPAEDDQGFPIDSEALAICVYRFPILPPSPASSPSVSQNCVYPSPPPACHLHKN